MRCRAYAFEHLANGWMIQVGVPTTSVVLLMTVLLAGCALGLSVRLAYWVTLHFTSAINSLVREALAEGEEVISPNVLTQLRRS